VIRFDSLSRGMIVSDAPTCPGRTVEGSRPVHWFCYLDITTILVSEAALGGAWCAGDGRQRSPSSNAECQGVVSLAQMHMRGPDRRGSGHSTGWQVHSSNQSCQ
jgi:hypothetical protein